MRKSWVKKRSELSSQVSCGQGAERRRMQGQREVWSDAKMKGWTEKLTHREGGNGVLIFSASAFGSTELLQRQLLSDWLKIRAVD